MSVTFSRAQQFHSISSPFNELVGNCSPLHYISGFVFCKLRSMNSATAELLQLIKLNQSSARFMIKMATFGNIGNLERLSVQGIKFAFDFIRYSVTCTYMYIYIFRLKTFQIIVQNNKFDIDKNISIFNFSNVNHGES